MKKQNHTYYKGISKLKSRPKSFIFKKTLFTLQNAVMDINTSFYYNHADQGKNN